jgi:5'(3')-deoxyribonucleotidase
MNRESIAFDVDDVLALHVESFIDFSNKNYGTKLTKDDYRDHWSVFWNVEHDEIERRALEFQTTERVFDFAVDPESIPALKKLKTKYDLYIVTARRKHITETTKDWVEKHFPDTFKGIHFVPIWTPGNKVTKADICSQIGASYLVDDLPRHCNIAAEGGIKAILFGDNGWSRDEAILDGVTRCKNWSQLLQYFDLLT